MVELLSYLRANGFKTFIVSGGGIEFMRPWVEKAYGIPPEQVVGSSGVTKFSLPSAIPMATLKCYNGPRQAVALASWALCTTPTPSVNSPMTGSRVLAASTRHSMRLVRKGGVSSI
jgi:hypothetical protein